MHEGVECLSESCHEAPDDFTNQIREPNRGLLIANSIEGVLVVCV